MQDITVQPEPFNALPTYWPISCAGSQSPGKDMPTPPAPDPTPAKAPPSKPKKKK